jgi:NADPH-dependent glutamate synthase beta subunit-like oxidoreductase
VTLIDADTELGGLMRTGIPVYRLPRDALDRDVQRILGLGIETVLDRRIDFQGLQRLTREYDAGFAATGLQRLTSLDLDTDLVSGQGCVIQGIEFLDQARRNAVRVSGEDVIVVGGGNTAVDAARSAHRLGAASVRIVYRRTRLEMPAIPEEVDDAIDEGIVIDFLCSPVRISHAGEKRLLTCERMELGLPDDSGRRRPIVVPDSAFGLPCDRVILAIGQAADLSLLPADATLVESQPVQSEGAAPVYPAGDLLTNEGTVTAAIGCGRDMALRLHEHFSGERLYRDPPPASSVVRADRMRLQHFETHQPHAENVLPFSARLGSFEEVRRGLVDVEEARRCLSCGVCNQCDRCVTYCPDGVLRRDGNDLVFDYDYCKGCGVCASECSRAVIYMKAG